MQSSTVFKEAEPIEPILAQTTEVRAMSATGDRRRAFSLDASMIKPSLMEKKVLDNEQFSNLSNRFKRIFGNDEKDKRKLVIPVSGYGGHQRGEKC